MTEDMFTGGGSTADRERRVVGVANYVVSDDGQTLVAYGLGSCVAVGLYDPANGIGALAHVMLPRQPSAATNPPGKYADTTVRAMLEALIEAGGSYASVEGWVVGGADIFPLADLDLPEGIGRRTAAVARETLAALDVQVVDETVGGEEGRTVVYDTSTGEYRVYDSDDADPLVVGE